ncbi:PiggyBac transposable element-derived protein 4 [Araneus ventricosus]|uniref:PiggyBac transposable element-derived protein 4 n=1 Tax=Araneus ventricosus TaxID=182803 RepID=A0A4Y2DFV8_ARAVE|nr:PiggyBac transposable element-derived protein 4 [Araneus ventricosus]
MKFLHFTNNGTMDTNNHPQPGLRKIYELFDALNRKFKSSYIPECEVSVDESLLLYKGRLAFKQYIPNKRSKFGIKFYQLCEARSGYIWNSLIYTGKDMPLWQEASKYSTTTNIVMTLIENLLGRGYCVTLDNFYTSPELAETLLSNRTDVYGTLRSHRRGIPQEIKSRILKKGEIIGFQKGKMCILKYMDKKPICMLSTIHTINFVEQCKKKKKKKSNGDVEDIITKKPKAILDYNRTMGGVHMADQCLSYYPTVRNQQKKYYKKIFRQLLNQSVWNAFVLFKKCGGKMTHLDFRMNLVQSLLQTYGEKKHLQHPVADRLTGRHFASHIEATEKKKMPTRVCIVCSKKFDDKGRRVRKESRFECKQCNVALCIVPCFERYHTVQDF